VRAFTRLSLNLHKFLARNPTTTSNPSRAIAGCGEGDSLVAACEKPLRRCFSRQSAGQRKLAVIVAASTVAVVAIAAAIIVVVLFLAYFTRGTRRRRRL
jgi:hypothetical protein